MHCIVLSIVNITMSLFKTSYCIVNFQWQGPLKNCYEKPLWGLQWCHGPILVAHLLRRSQEWMMMMMASARAPTINEAHQSGWVTTPTHCLWCPLPPTTTTPIPGSTQGYIRILRLVITSCSSLLFCLQCPQRVQCRNDQHHGFGHFRAKVIGQSYADQWSYEVLLVSDDHGNPVLQCRFIHHLLGAQT